MPFDIPDTWEWARLGNIVYNHGQKKPDTDFCYIDIGSINNNEQRLSSIDTVLCADAAPSRARKIVEFGDILYATVRPYLHNMCIINHDFMRQPIASTGFAVMSCFNGINKNYLFDYLRSPTFDRYANNTENAKGVAYPAINDDRLYKALIAVPPTKEQESITQTVNAIFSKIKGES